MFGDGGHDNAADMGLDLEEPVRDVEADMPSDCEGNAYWFARFLSWLAKEAVRLRIVELWADAVVETDSLLINGTRAGLSGRVPVEECSEERRTLESETGS